MCTQETGKAQCIDLAAALGWKYVKAYGLKGNGLNAVFYSSEWTLTESRDHNLPSFGQWQRTLVLAELVPSADSELNVTRSAWFGSFHAAAAASDLTREQANVAKLAQVKEVNRLTADLPAVVIGADLARADDDDDLAYLKAQGWTLHGRALVTPECAFSRGAFTPGRVGLIDAGQATDHAARLITLTI